MAVASVLLDRVIELGQPSVRMPNRSSQEMHDQSLLRCSPPLLSSMDLCKNTSPESVGRPSTWTGQQQPGARLLASRAERHAGGSSAKGRFAREHSGVQAGDWVCKHCHRLLVTADRVVSRKAEGSNHKVGESSESAAPAITAAEQAFLLVKPQRWMGGSLAAAQECAGSSLPCPK